MEINPGQPIDLAYQLPRDMYHQLIHAVCAALPAPIIDTPENRVRRDNAAIAQIASMLPANAEEANLAAQQVLAQAEALDLLRLVRGQDPDDKRIPQWTTRSLGMMRQATTIRRLLLRLQSDRQKREANNQALDQANWIEHCAISLMADALGRPQPAPIAQPAPEPADEPHPDLLTEAEQYAIDHPHRAALIHFHGGLPARPDFVPPSLELAYTIANGTTPILRALDSPATAPA
jgi:hypothetical protein